MRSTVALVINHDTICSTNHLTSVLEPFNLAEPSATRRTPSLTYTPHTHSIMNDTSKERSIISIALLYIKHPEHCYYFWDYADRKEGFESYILFGVVHAMANNREYRDLHDIEFTDGELRRAKMLSNSLLESLATASY